MFRSFHRRIAVQEELAERLDGFEMASLFLVLKTTLEVLDEAQAKALIRPAEQVMAGTLEKTPDRLGTR